MDLLELRAICLKLHVSDGKGFVERGKVRHRKKDVKNEGRSDYVYENKDTDDNFTATKDGISMQLHAILHRNTRILEELSAFCQNSTAGERISRVGMPILGAASFCSSTWRYEYAATASNLRSGKLRGRRSLLTGHGLRIYSPDCAWLRIKRDGESGEDLLAEVE